MKQKFTFAQMNTKKSLLCIDCGIEVENVGFDAVSVICSKCVQLRLNPNMKYVDENTDMTLIH